MSRSRREWRDKQRWRHKETTIAAIAIQIRGECVIVVALKSLFVDAHFLLRGGCSYSIHFSSLSVVPATPRFFILG